MAYDLFLFDLDDTLLDFKASERLSFFSTLKSLGVDEISETLFAEYQGINKNFWKLFEENKVTQAHLKVERFRELFKRNKMEIDPELASTRYLETLPECVVLMDHAVEICEWLHPRGEIGIITNGILSAQIPRIRNSKLAHLISFTVVSEACGFAKPDVRFFEHTSKQAKQFAKHTSLVIGDRLETDIVGAHQFGVDACWFNPAGHGKAQPISPKYEIRHLSELRQIIERD